MLPTKKIIDGEVVQECCLCLELHTHLTDALTCCKSLVTPEKVYPPRVTEASKSISPDPEQVFGKGYAKAF